MSKRSWRNPKTIFYYNKELLAKGSISERFVNPFQERFDNPTVGNSAYKLFPIMSEEKKFVTKDTVRVPVTPAQQNLLNILPINEIPDFVEHLKTLQKNGTYYLENPHKEDLQASLNVLWFIEGLEEVLRIEQSTNLKSA